MQHDLAVTLEILKLLAILGAGAGVVIAILRTAGKVIINVTQAVTRFELIGDQQANEIKELKEKISKLSEIVQQIATEKVRLDGHAQRLTRVESLVDELRRGEGYILPLEPRLGQGPR